MKNRGILVVVVGLWSLTLGLTVVAAMLMTVGPTSIRRPFGEWLPFVPEVLAFSTAGALIAWRRPSMPSGWLLSTVGLVWTLIAALHAYVNHALAVGPRTLPAVELAGWVANWVWILAFVALGLFFLLYPDGRLPSPRWRVVVGLGVLGSALVLLGRAFTPGPLAEFSAIANPFGIQDGGRLLPSAEAVGQHMTTVASIASIASLLVRYRRADAMQRRQLLWMALAAVVFLVGAGIADIVVLIGAEFDTGALYLGSIAGVPVAAAIAILRYRLYDIDRVVTKTLVYLGLGAFITTVFLFMAVGLAGATGIERTPSLVWSIVATAVVAVIYKPVRTRVERVASRVVYGRRLTPYEVLAAFSRRMGEPFATEDLLPEMARILADGTGANRAKVWLAVGGEVTLAAGWPLQSSSLQPLRLMNGDPMSSVDDTKTVPVRYEGQLLGALSVTKPQGEPLTSAEDKLLSDLAAQAGLALRNVGLIGELKASRQRIVAAQDAERRHLERDIHDGAQQRLVTLSLALRMARNRPGLNPVLAKALENAARELNDGLFELRELARGIHPTILTDEGLGPALASLAIRSTIPAQLAAAPNVRFPAAVEATAYQVVSDALAAATQAGASTARMTVEHATGKLVVQVDHDGRGEVGASHVPGLADRVAALDGQLETETTIDERNAVRAVIPCESY